MHPFGCFGYCRVSVLVILLYASLSLHSLWVLPIADSDLTVFATQTPAPTAKAASQSSSAHPSSTGTSGNSKSGATSSFSSSLAIGGAVMAVAAVLGAVMV